MNESGINFVEAVNAVYSREAGLQNKALVYRGRVSKRYPSPECALRKAEIGGALCNDSKRVGKQRRRTILNRPPLVFVKKELCPVADVNGIANPCHSHDRRPRRSAKSRAD